MRPRARISLVLLVAVGSPVVHELRCFLGFGPGRQQAAVEQGHLYLGSPAIALTLLCGVALGSLVLQVVWGNAADREFSVPRVWLTTFLALLGLVVVQELAEGLFARPASPWETFAEGGWLAIPLCATLALGIALWLRVCTVAAARLARRTWSRLATNGAPARRPGQPPVFRPLSPLALSRAGRAPPLAVESLST